MSKIFISFLGTNAYLHTKYKINNFISKPVRYVQEALVEYFCKDWTEQDKILIFATKGENGSIKKNWEIGEINKFDEFGKKYEETSTGLKYKLEKLNLKCKIKMIPIPDGIKEGEIWEIIQKIYENININDELYIDITHSFRYIPMIIPSMITFLRTLKQIKLASIHYGAFEILGTSQEIVKIELEKRIAPVRELKELYEMIEWSEATNAFLKHGYGKNLMQKLDYTEKIKEISPIIHTIKKGIEFTETAIKFNNVKGLKKFFIPKNKKIDLIKYPELFTINELLPKIENFIGQWENNEIKNGLLAAKWCLENDRFSQSITFTQEALITFFCDLFKWNKNNNSHRGAVSFMIQIALGEKNLEEHNYNGKDWFDKTKNFALNELKKLDRKFLENYDKIRKWRNIINHAGIGDRKQITQKYPIVFEEIYDYINKIYSERI